MKLLSISGGSTKIAGLAGAADCLINEKNYKPDYIVGTSAGSILALPIALGYWNMIRKNVLGFTLDDIFSVKPVNKEGKISFIGKLRILFGELSLGKQDNLRKKLSELITEVDFDTYKNGNFPIVYVGCVDYRTGSRIYVNIKKVNYSDYLDYIMASTSIPYAVEPVFKQGKILFDGGTRDHIGSHWMLENIKGIAESVSIFSRPKEMASILDKNWSPENIFDIFRRDQDIRVLEISKKDEKIEQLIADKLNIKHTAIFIPWVVEALYGTNNADLKKLYKEGFNSAKNFK